ncbi:MAG TPA: hypothetical protein PKV78_08830, partial [Methanoculleus thermophilus]|nr:hypothetical protein [Methanoculleus thermophilus]
MPAPIARYLLDSRVGLALFSAGSTQILVVAAYFRGQKGSKRLDVWLVGPENGYRGTLSSQPWVPQAAPATVRRFTRPVTNRMGERPARPEAKGMCALPVL